MSSIAARLSLPRIFAPGSPITGIVLAIVLGLGVIAGSMASGGKDLARFVVGATGALILFVVAVTGRTTAVKVTVGLLVFLGLIRRLLIPFAGWSPQDPLLLVGPAAGLLIWINGRKEAPKKKDALTMLVLFFVFWTLGQLFNPDQRSLLSSLYGLIFWLPALVWFFAGRTIPLRVHKSLVKILMVLAIYVAAHGLYHAYVGLLSFEYTWVGVSGFGSAIFINGFNIRPFSTLVSPQEYGIFLAFVCCFLWSRILAEPKFRGWMTLLFLYLMWALFMQGSRSIFGATAIMMVVTAVVWSKGAMRVAVAAIVLSLFWFIRGIAPPDSQTAGAGTVDSIITHQLIGLLNPGSEQSTGALHVSMIQEGFNNAWENPLGVGLGATTIAASKDKVERLDRVGTEADITDTFLTFGIPGGVAFLFLYLFMFGAAGRRFKANRTAYSLGVVGVTVIAVGHLWQGAMYSMMCYFWLTLGALTRPFEEESEEVPLSDDATAGLERPEPNPSTVASAA